MRTFTNTKTSMHELNTISTPSMKHHTELDAQVSRLYEQNMQLATYKLALADARLSIAEYKLAILNHCSTCQTCILGETCEVLTKIQPLSRKSSSLEMAPPIPIDINTNISMNSGSAGHSTDKVPSAVQLQSGLLDAVLASDDLASKPSPSTETS